jgi:hypothetical protein
MGGRHPPPPVSRNILASAERRPGYVTLLCADQTVYLSRHYQVWRREKDGLREEPLAAPKVPWLRKQASRLPYLRRLGRLWVREMIQADRDHLLAVVQRRLVRCHRRSGESEEVLRVEDGGRPKGLVITPQGLIFSGEYWDNPQRRGPAHLGQRRCRPFLGPGVLPAGGRGQAHSQPGVGSISPGNLGVDRGCRRRMRFPVHA